MGDRNLETCLDLTTQRVSQAVASSPHRPLARPGAIIGRDRFRWDHAGDILSLHRGRSREPFAQVEPDANWPVMFRVRSGAWLSDMANLTRAKDAALSAALRALNYKAQEEPSRAAYVRRQHQRVGTPQASANGASAASKKLRGFA
jgi:hypothetical protein